MAKRGRPPKPTKQRLLEGNAGRRPLPVDEPEPEPGIPDCPVELEGDARTEWDRIVGEMTAMRTLTKSFRATLVAYCLCWDMAMQATREMKKNGGAVVKAPSGFPIQNPWLSIRNKALAQLNTFAGELGLSPSSKSRVKSLGSGAPKKSSLAAFNEKTKSKPKK